MVRSPSASSASGGFASDAACAPTLIRWDALVASRWKNGGGVTREIAAGPAGAALDAFAWRVSVADVGVAGPFSAFPGIDRTLVLLSGAGMTLVEDGDGRRGVERHTLRAPLDAIAFAGETGLRAELHDGPTRDFNLMVRRALMCGAVAVWRPGERHVLARAHAAAGALLFCADGEVTLAFERAADGEAAAGAADSASAEAPDGVALGLYDSLQLGRIGAPLFCTVGGNGALLAVTLTPLA